MPRKMIIHLEGGKKPVLVENLADSEEQLQELIKEHPELLPTEEFGLDDTLMVVGRETSLPSGAIDLVGLTRSGDLLVIEFKTGPQNSDFRRALAQLLDYGSDLWGMTYEEFETTVVRRYFASSHCVDDRLKGMASLSDAVHVVWDDMPADEISSFRDRLSTQLTNGAFKYVLIAQKFRPSVLRTIEYLNWTSRSFQFFVVELVKFVSDGISAYETRTVVKPSAETRVGNGSKTNQEEVLRGIEDVQYREAIKEFFELCHGLGLTLFWGTVGASIRTAMPSGTVTTIGWWFPPGRSGWMGFNDLTLGIGNWYLESNPDVVPYTKKYLENLSSIIGVDHETRGGTDAFHFGTTVVVEAKDRIAEILAEFVSAIRSAN